jgi:hypothetical protein
MALTRFDKLGNGVITADDFRKLWRETKEAQKLKEVHRAVSFTDPAKTSFEAGQIFSKYDTNRDGKLDKNEFEQLMQRHPEIMRNLDSYGMNSNDMPVSIPALVKKREIPVEIERSVPTEIITGRLLTHYDETAGVAIPQSSVEQHASMGNTIIPLVDAYKSRYDRLRGLLTARLLPRREHLIQLRRQLENCSAEVSAARKAIERETQTDADQIIARLQSSESMRQSSIKHQVQRLMCIR